ncbi:uncharacterized protein LOC120429615 [Culex pipiens pallens]|uniref:uncharacterized protein LOC120429615 n=1 Tax=Culex pipiens pallens TaxID=42434 RepID=UPI00195386AE|nr:uncharacterized protein LOC120429615 [Culex pipiens pallens]
MILQPGWMSFILLILAWLPPGSSFEPFTQHDLAAETLDCFVHLGVPPGRVRLYQAGLFPDDPGTWCLVRCVAIKLDLYGDRCGPDVGNLYVQFGGVAGGQSEVRFKQAAHSCIAGLADQYRGACERAYHMMIDCFGEQIRKLVAQNRTDPCADCYRMYDALYRSTMVEKKPSDKCGKSGKCNTKKKKKKLIAE